MFAALAYCAEPTATPVTSIVARPGFQVELLRSAGKDEGSWISMTFDHRGRLIVGLDKVGIARLTLADDPAKTQFALVEKMFRHCRGVLYAHDSLYVSATDSKGFYRLRDTTGDDRFDEVRLLKKLDYRSRYGHGSNQVVLGPDQMIYLVNGNDVSFPEGTSPTSPYRDPRNDHLLPNPHDAGHDNRVGHILRTDSEGERWEVIAGGLRNQVDIAFDAEGEMFTYDADMELDVGQPWYRPTRVNHVVSAGEYGWRLGTGKWPGYFQDSLPTTLDTGLGSPTGMVFGTKSNFPPRYRNALFMADWQNGRILLVDLIPAGASFTCRYEVFIEGGPLNVCDLQFGPDGALYFITGGRGSQSGLYRVVATAMAAKAVKPLPVIDAQVERQARLARKLRRKLESFHVRRDTEAVDEIWPYLDSDDRWLRFAARRAIENQDVAAWRMRALGERRPNAAIAGLMALCRTGATSDRDAVLHALGRIEVGQLNQDQLLGLLRTYQLCFIRLGGPGETAAKRVSARLTDLYPHPTSSGNHLLCELLVYLQDEAIVAKAVQQLSGDYAQEDQIRTARTLTHAAGWTLESRRAVSRWLQSARAFRGGRHLGERIGDIRQDFLAALSDEERRGLRDEIAELEKPPKPAPDLPARLFVRQWKMDDLKPRLDEVSSGRSFTNGRRALLAANCLSCHSIGSSGAQIGPDLSSVGRRYDTAAILESILAPSKVMDPKYRHTVYALSNGKTVTGKPVRVNRTTITVETDPLRQTTVGVKRAEIEESYPANISPMPSGLVNVLTAEEILDLLAFLKSGGNPGDAAFQK